MAAVCPLPTGIISVMRQLENADCLPLAAFTGGHGHIRRCLSTLQDIYGAVEDTAAGWRLTYVPQWLQPPRLPLPATILDEVASTQQAVCRHQPPHALFAEHQTVGVGRGGRGWLGLPADAVAVSVLLPAPPIVGGLSVALGAMLCAALSEGRQLRFKWPNDIVDCQQRKIAGILTEIVGGQLIVGIGVNWQLTTALRAQISSLGTTPAALTEVQSAVSSRQQCAQTVVQAVVDTVAAYEEGFAPFRVAAEAAHIATIGDKLQVAGSSGVFLGFAEDGALLTMNGGKRVRHISGEVKYVAGG